MKSIKQVEIEAIRNKKKVTGKDGKEKNQGYLPYTYLMSESVDMWTQSHNGGRRFGVMTTNISQCFNGVLKGARGLPIAAMVEFTWSKLVEYFHNRHKEYHYELSKGKKWSEYAFDTWDRNKRKSKKPYLKAFRNQQMLYHVVTSFNMCSVGGGNHSYEVWLQERPCNCGKWPNIGILCSHAIRVCDALKLIRSHIFTYVIVWPMPLTLTHMHL